MSDVLTAIKERFSTRGYTEERLTEAELTAIIDAGLQAPTAANKQEIHITVVDGDNPILSEIEAEMVALRGGQKPGKSFYYGAPTVFFLSGDAAFSWTGVDAGIAVQNMTLAAEGLGLGSLIIGCVRDAMLGEKKTAFNARLGFPEGYDFQVALAVGHKAVTKEPHTYDAVTHVNRA